MEFVKAHKPKSQTERPTSASRGVGLELATLPSEDTSHQNEHDTYRQVVPELWGTLAPSIADSTVATGTKIWGSNGSSHEQSSKCQSISSRCHVSVRSRSVVRDDGNQSENALKGLVHVSVLSLSSSLISWLIIKDKPTYVVSEVFGIVYASGKISAAAQ